MVKGNSSNNGPGVTVLMPVYNGEKFIKQSIRSVLNQTFGDFELLLVDDRGADKSIEIARSINDSRIQILRNKSNLGLSGSLNQGLKHAKGRYIARLDQDDIVLPQRLELQTKFLDSHPDYGLIGCWSRLVDSNNKAKGEWRGGGYWEWYYYTLFFRNCLTHSSVMYRKELALGLSGYDPKLTHCEDYDLWWRMSKRAKIGEICKPLIKLRRHQDSFSTIHEDKVLQTALGLASDHLKSLEKTRLVKLTECEFESLCYGPQGNLQSKSYLKIILNLELINRRLLKETVKSFPKVSLKNLKLAMSEKMLPYFQKSTELNSWLDSLRLIFQITSVSRLLLLGHLIKFRFLPIKVI